MTMIKTLTIAFTLTLLGLVATLGAQSYVLSNTTLSGAITATQTTLVLASASVSSGATVPAPAVGQCLMDDTEVMRITAVSGTTMTVSRAPVNPVAHATSSVIWTGPCQLFKSTDPPVAAVNATAGQQLCSTQPRPWINVTNGNVWICNTMNNGWRGTNAITFTYGSSPVAQ